MEAIISSRNGSPNGIYLNEIEKPTLKEIETTEAFAELERGVYAALETYSNVHRGSGYNSMVTTRLFDEARNIVLEYLGLNKDLHVVIFCTPRSAVALVKQLKPDSFQILSSQDFGLTLGVRVLAVQRKLLPKVIPFHAGGGTARLMSKDWVIWAKAPDKFEAGTPAIINIIAFAKALRMIKHSGENIFMGSSAKKLTAADVLYHDELEKYSGRELLEELQKTLIGRGILVPTIEGNKPFVNLDNSASTPTFTPIWNAFRQTWHQPKETKQEIINEVKSICSEMLGATLTDYDVIFTSNTTEAINIAAESLSRESEDGIGPVVLNTLLEHSSNDLLWRMIPGSSLIRLSVDADGFVDLNELETLLINYNLKEQNGKKRIKLVAMSGASNVLGVCNNLSEISRIVHQHGARLLVDAAQLVSHRKISMEECGIDYLAFSAHKVYAPFGSGALVVKKGLLKFNSKELELIQSSGEENAGGIAALGKALVLLQRIGMDLIQEEEQILTARTLHCMSQINGLEIYGVKRTESSGFKNKLGVIAFGLKNKMAPKVGKELALLGGIGVRTGCHCAHIIVKHILHVGPGLEKFQKFIVTLFPKLSLPGVVRVSLGIETSEEDVDRLIQTLEKIASLKESNKTSSDTGTAFLSGKKVQFQIDKFIDDAVRRVYN